MSRSKLSRRLLLRCNATPDVAGETQPFRKVTTRSHEGHKWREERWREGDTLHVKVERNIENVTPFGMESRYQLHTLARPCFVDYQELLDDVVVEHDDRMSAPWEEHDGWEHELVPFRDMDLTREQIHSIAWNGCVYRGQLIQLRGEDEPELYEYYRSVGASRQVARELLAQRRRSLLKQLKNWYEDGFNWWMAKIRVHLDKDYEDCLGGILADDEDEVFRASVPEMLHGLIYTIEEDGYEVVNRPDRRKLYLEHRREEHKRRLALFNWRD